MNPCKENIINHSQLSQLCICSFWLKWNMPTIYLHYWPATLIKISLRSENRITSYRFQFNLGMPKLRETSFHCLKNELVFLWYPATAINKDDADVKIHSQFFHWLPPDINFQSNCFGWHFHLSGTYICLQICLITTLGFWII